ncbi:MAG: hypothetical protein V4612_00900 [Pseudomonadota bacterium]
MNERTRDEVKESLYLLAKELKIIPDNFSEDDFKARFFYFFIERDHGYYKQPFEENVFGKSYARPMFFAFESSFQKLIAGEELSLALIEDLRRLSYIARLDTLNPLQYRKRLNSQSYIPIQPHKTSSKFLKQIIADDHKTKLDLLEYSVGKYVHYFMSNKLILIKEVTGDVDDPIELKNIINELIECYKNKLQKIKEDTSISADEQFHQKINLIGFFIGDMDRLHPYRDGNGRLDDFLLANYLLIQEGMSPCIIFQPWNFAYVTAEERFFAIIEGQRAYEYYFLNGHKITDDAGLVLREPLTEEMKSVPIKFIANDEEIYKKTIDLFLFYNQITAAELLNQNPNYHPKIDTTKLKESLSETITFLTQDPHNIENLESFCVPIKHKDIIRIVTLAGALPLFDRDTVRQDEAEKYDFLKTHYKFDIERYRSDDQYKDQILKGLLPRVYINFKPFCRYWPQNYEYQTDEVARDGVLWQIKEKARYITSKPKKEKILKLVKSEFLLPVVLQDKNYRDGLRYDLVALNHRLRSRGYKFDDERLPDDLPKLTMEKHPDLTDEIKAHFRSVANFTWKLGNPNQQEGCEFGFVSYFIKNYCLEILKPKTSPEPNLGAAASLQVTQESGQQVPVIS